MACGAWRMDKIGKSSKCFWMPETSCQIPNSKIRIPVSGCRLNPAMAEQADPTGKQVNGQTG
jgi:hypothetical protein